MTYEDFLMKEHRAIQKRVYFTGVEADAVENRASFLGLSESSYIRRLVLLDLETARRKRVCDEELGSDRAETGMF